MRQYEPPGTAGSPGRGIGTGDDDRDTAEIRVEIEQTRTEMSGTIEEIQQRLAPDVLSAQAKDVARDATEQAKSAAQEVLQDAVREVKDAAKEVTAHAVHEVRDAARDVTSDAKDAAWDATVGRAENAVGTVGETARGATSIVIETIKQNPIPAALAGLSLFWLYRNRSGGQASSGAGFGTGSFQTSGPYQATRTTQAYPIRTGYAPQEERDAMVADAARTGMGTRSQVQGTRYDGEHDGGVMDSAGRMASSSGQMAGSAASSAGQMASDAVSSAGHMASNAGDTAMDTGSDLLGLIQRNPIPAALVGIGLGWLYMNRSSGQPDYRAHSGTHYRYGAGAAGQAYGSGSQSSGDGSMIGRATEQVSEMAGSAQERVADVAGSVQGQVGDMADTVMHRTQRAPGQLQRMIEERPLTAAAVAASLGAAVGLWLPTTQVEQGLMGPVHDQAMDRVQQVANDTIDKVGSVAQEVRSTVKEEARSQGLTV
jgi:ElaB/YqjD/DUF883 family membrane-anchored ribosome-binding protein